MTKIGVISDTHVKEGGKRMLAPIVFDLFAGVDLILHAGDLNTMQTVRDLEAIAPVLAVYGNNCDWEALQTLPATREIVVEEVKIGMTHGDVGKGGDTIAKALSYFPDADCVVFGHSHWPLIHWKKREIGGRVLLFNPGSAGQKRKALRFSCGILQIDGKRIDAELKTWD
jgi:putative phosphoesterase